MIELTGLTKKYGSVTAVESVTTTIAPGIATGFLGPNGAGKSTTMRMIVGLDRPTSGTALVNGRSLLTNRRALTEVGTLLDAGVAHANRTARNHLKALAQSNGLATTRVDEVLGMVGLSSVKDKRAGGFSLGMRQRLGLAAALIGDAPVLLLDEPVNGLDRILAKLEPRDRVQAVVRAYETGLILPGTAGRTRPNDHPAPWARPLGRFGMNVPAPFPFDVWDLAPATAWTAVDSLESCRVTP